MMSMNWVIIFLKKTFSSLFSFVTSSHEMSKVYSLKNDFLNCSISLWRRGVFLILSSVRGSLSLPFNGLKRNAPAAYEI